MLQNEEFDPNFLDSQERLGMEQAMSSNEGNESSEDNDKGNFDDKE